MFFRQAARIGFAAAALVLVAAPAFAAPAVSLTPEPSTLGLLGVAIPGAAAWIKRKIG
jgi:hypothetical protein